MEMDIVAYGESYNLAMQGLEDMLIREENPMKTFKKSTYPDNFEAFCSKYAATLDAVEAVYQQEEDKEAWLTKLAQRMTAAAKNELEAIPKKGKRYDQQVNYNMQLVVFVFPALAKREGSESAEPLTDAIVKEWNGTFKTTVSKATYDQIMSGFTKKFCYITTAVCESQGKPDDCYELEALRAYRDEYLLPTDEGAAMVKEYYNIAPTIVSRIAKEENPAAVYGEIWDRWLSGCIRLIEDGEPEACKERYRDMVYELKARYVS